MFLDRADVARFFSFALLGDMILDTPKPVIAARFHKGLAKTLVAMVRKLADGGRFDTVALSGGCFQNAVLFEETAQRLEAEGLIERGARIRRTKWVELSCILCGEAVATLEGGTLLRPRSAKSVRVRRLSSEPWRKPRPPTRPRASSWR